MTDVHTVTNLADAARQIGPDSVYLGGGTVLMRDVNSGYGPPRLVRATDPSLRQINALGDRVTLGAGVTMAQILAQPDLAFLHPVARMIGGPQVRVMATVGGNLFAPHPYGDFAVALLALGARVTMAGTSAGSGQAVDDVLRGRDRPSGLVAAIEIPRPAPDAFGFKKVARVKPKGVSVLSIAVLAPRAGGRISGARVAWGAMAPGPVRGQSVERVLEGQALDTSTIARAAQVAVDGLDPPTDALATTWYRKEVAGVHLTRLLNDMQAGGSR
ncbi:MAG: FAD binding domain-containing protein [Pseudomonadota bacterium]